MVKLSLNVYEKLFNVCVYTSYHNIAQIILILSVNVPFRYLKGLRDIFKNLSWIIFFIMCINIHYCVLGKYIKILKVFVLAIIWFIII